MNHVYGLKSDHRHAVTTWSASSMSKFQALNSDIAAVRYNWCHQCRKSYDICLSMFLVESSFCNANIGVLKKSGTNLLSAQAVSKMEH